MKKAIMICIFALTLMSCQFVTIIQPTVTPNPTATVTVTRTTTYTPQPTVTLTSTPQTACDPNVFIEALKPYVPYETFMLSYQIVDGIRYLDFWIVDPELDPMAEEGDLAQNVDAAMLHAINLSHLLNQTDHCVSEYFDAINPVVVDRNYNGWFAGIIDVSLLPRTAELSQEDIQLIQDDIRYIGTWERDFVPEIQSIPADSCTWDEALELIMRHFYVGTLNNYMIVADNNGVNIMMQYATFTPEDYDGTMYANYLNVQLEIGCLNPPVDNIVVTMVDEFGNVLDSQWFQVQN